MNLPLYIPVAIPGSKSITAVSSSQCSSFFGLNRSKSPSTPSRRVFNSSIVKRTQVTCSGNYNTLTGQKKEEVTPTPPETGYKETPLHWRVPIFGFIIELFLTKVTNVQLARKYGSVYKTDFLGNLQYIVTDMSAINQIYKDTKTFVSRAAYPKMFLQVFGNDALFALDGHRHKQKRLTVAPAFSPYLFDLYFQPLVTRAKNLWSEVEADMEKKQTIKLEKYVREHYLRQIMRVTTGSEKTTYLSFEEIRDNCYNVPSGVFFSEVKPIVNAAMKSRRILIDAYSELVKEKLVKSADKIDQLRSLGDNLATEARQSLKDGDLDILTVAIALSPLKTGPGQTYDPAVLEELAQLILLLWLAGYATQATSTLSSMLTMGSDKEIWKRLVAEQDALVKKYNDKEITNRQVMKEMPLLDSFYTEILRMSPPAVTFFRKTSCDTSVLGHFIPKDSMVTIDVWAAQMNDKYYENADNFIIDRFLNKDVKPPPSIYAFGVPGGAHYCIGAALAKVSVKTTLAVLLRHYEFSLSPKQSKEFIAYPEQRPVSGVIIDSFKRR